jgi:hypothetical protein
MHPLERKIANMTPQAGSTSVSVSRNAFPCGNKSEGQVISHKEILEQRTENDLGLMMKLLQLFLALGVMVIITECSTVDGGDPYFRGDPGAGIQRFAAAELEITAETVSAWEKWRTSDGRILPDTRSVFEYADNPFDGEPGLIKFSTYYDPAAAGRSFGGFGIRAPLPHAVSVDTADTFIEFDLY